jgi:hypothetical protein
MANVPATIEQVPAYLMKYREDQEFNRRFKDLSSVPLGMLSLDGKHFTFRRSGQENWLISDKNDNPVQFLDICIIDSNPNKSRSYWKGSIDPNNVERPDCSSINGDVPDSGVPNRQSPTCPSCKWSKWGTALKPEGTPGTGQRCREGRRLAILPVFDMLNEEWGGPMLLRVPPTSLANLTNYANERDRAGQNLNMIVTRIRYNPQIRHQQLQFTFNRWLDEEEAFLMERWYNDPIKERIMFANVNEKGEQVGPTIDEPDTIEEDITAIEVKHAIATVEKQAAAKAVAQAGAGAGKGNGQEEPIRRDKPVLKRAAVVTPVAEKKVTAVEVVKGRPKTVDQLKAEKQARLDKLLAEAAALDDELNPETEETAATEAPEVLADAENEEGDDISTADLLGALDSQDLHGVPD